MLLALKGLTCSKLLAVLLWKVVQQLCSVLWLVKIPDVRSASCIICFVFTNSQSYLTKLAGLFNNWIVTTTINTDHRMYFITRNCVQTQVICVSCKLLVYALIE